MVTQALRQVMRQWVTGVTVMTVRVGDQLHGMTCNSFTSVSFDPPTILVCVRNDSRTRELVQQAGGFAVSLLPAEHQEWSDRFAGVYGSLQDEFGDVSHRLAPSGAPWLDGALGWLDTRTVATYPGGTHTIFVAEVTAAEGGDDAAAPLVRFRSAYTRLG